MGEISQMFFHLYDKVMLLHKNNTKVSSVSIPEMTLNDEYYLDILYCLGTPTYTEFSEAAKITKPAATQIIKRFIEKDYVQKIQLEEDRRVYHLQICDTVNYEVHQKAGRGIMTGAAAICARYNPPACIQ